MEKSCALAGKLLELGGAADAGTGEEEATRTLADGRAYERFRRILEAQGGDPDIASADLEPGAHHSRLEARREGVVTGFDLKAIVRIARAAGAPRTRGAGLLVPVEAGQAVAPGEALLEVFAESPGRLDEAMALARRIPAVRSSERHAFGFVE